MILTLPSRVRSMFCGFMSLCTRPRFSIAFMPLTVWASMSIASTLRASGVMKPESTSIVMLLATWLRSPPSASSMIMCNEPSSLTAAPCISTIFSAPTSFSSPFSARRWVRISPAIASRFSGLAAPLSDLTTTDLPVTGSRKRRAAPKPPSPRVS